MRSENHSFGSLKKRVPIREKMEIKLLNTFIIIVQLELFFQISKSDLICFI